MITAWKHIPEYQVDEAMLGSYFQGTEDDVGEFCEILQTIVGNRVTIVNTDTYNGASHNCAVGGVVTDKQWNAACERLASVNPQVWE